MLIHRYWTGQFAPLHEPWLGNCLRSLNPNIECQDWTDDSIPSEYKRFFNDSQVRERDREKHRANIVRLLLLYDFGGWWYDYDVVPLLPVTTLPRPSVGAHGGLCNSFMSFEIHDRRLEEALDGILEQPESERPSTVVSGSTFLPPYLADVQRLSFPYSPRGKLITNERPFAIHLGSSIW